MRTNVGLGRTDVVYFLPTRDRRARCLSSHQSTVQYALSESLFTKYGALELSITEIVILGKGKHWCALEMMMARRLASYFDLPQLSGSWTGQ